MEVERPERQGAVTRLGKLMVLAVDGVPAKPFRVVRTVPKSPAVHVMEFATVEIAADGTVASRAAQLTLRAGTRLVILDLQLKGDRVHLFTHTADPLPDGRETGAVYGCTEFVFRIEPYELRTGQFESVAERIEQALTWTPTERVCAPGYPPVCMEP